MTLRGWKAYRARVRMARRLLNPRYPLRIIVTRTAITIFNPEPPRDSGEADAVHGPTALGTHHDNTSQEDRLGSDSSRP